MPRLGVLGWPVAHSRSPAMHNAAFASLGMADWRYQRLPVPCSRFAETTRSLRPSGFVGVNRTALALFSRSFPLEYPEIEALVVLQRKRFRFIEVPCKMRRRRAGRSTITGVKSLYYIAHVLLGVFVNILKFEGRRK